jgi:hypothetical protein
MLPQGVGYWSPCLGAAPGAKITVSLKMRGKDDEGRTHRPELTAGDYDWTEVKETIFAPEGAVRMALFLGLLPCKGKVNFDDIHITTASESR